MGVDFRMQVVRPVPEGRFERISGEVTPMRSQNTVLRARGRARPRSRRSTSFARKGWATGGQASRAYSRVASTRSVLAGDVAMPRRQLRTREFRILRAIGRSTSEVRPQSAAV